MQGPQKQSVVSSLRRSPVVVATGNYPMTASRSVYQTLEIVLALIGVTRASRVPNADSGAALARLLVVVLLARRPACLPG
jgi:uncharacterized membrane protein